MKAKFIMSSLVLLLFSILAGGSNDDDADSVLVAIFVVIGIIIVIAIISAIIERINKQKRIKMITADEQNSSDFDRSVSIGDDRCKLYFDVAKKKIMIAHITTEGITKRIVDDFEYPGKDLTKYTEGSYYVYEPKSRRLLRGNYGRYGITDFNKLDGVSKDEKLITPGLITPSFHILITSSNGTQNKKQGICTLVDEHHGLMAVSTQGKLKYAFNYVEAEKLPEKTGSESTVSVKNAGNYMFIMDDFFKVLFIIGENMHKSLHYSDIIEVSYEENGDQLFTKSTGRTIGGAIAGGVLLGGAGAVIGGLSGKTKKNKVVNNMDIKILLRNTEEATCILHFMDSSTPLKTKNSMDESSYEEFLKNANKAKDLLSIVIDDAKQTASQLSPAASKSDAPSFSVADELSKLADLKKQGILTDEEFRIQKEKLLKK